MQTWRDGRTAALSACDAMREVLASLGLPESAYAAIRPQVTPRGEPLVHLGSIPAAYVEQIAEALRGTRTHRERDSGALPI
ncbi:hypothetical protein GCM10010347_14330 [Streptomyces cirratus]|uniref:Uncharacterized protein n=1 Tax=Streptomyces cirratus TaxID=68187 RepID=A0ABQ3EM04_9ACTN|nr:hypothetical protein [Streptomyces cirratus]GHB45870.1 hypothetical protein GCM10010347_14330 [Streptomyces cirratus]